MRTVELNVATLYGPAVFSCDCACDWPEIYGDSPDMTVNSVTMDGAFFDAGWITRNWFDCFDEIIPILKKFLERDAEINFDSGSGSNEFGKWIKSEN